MKIAKQFRWEAAHRIPWHKGDCSNLHGHSYRMTVALEGTPNAQGMLVDFQAVKDLLRPLVKSMDHAIIVAHDDHQLLNIIAQTDWKHVVLPFDSTAENLATHVIDFFCKHKSDLPTHHTLTKVTVRIAETETCYAEIERPLDYPSN